MKPDSLLTNPRIIAVVVTYHPDLPKLQRQLDALTPQVHSIVVVDNDSSDDLTTWMADHAGHTHIVVQLERNHGIAHAQNMGIEHARKHSATHVLLMDQDSLPAPDMVSELLLAAQASASVASVGPRFMDTRQDNPPPFIRIRGLKLERVACEPGRPIVPVDYLIASGCLIPMAALDLVGPKREDLFIDYVDIEWGLRARREGLQSYGVCTATMDHSLGDEPLRFIGRDIPTHSPLRHYYHMRNAVLLYREPWIPLNWKLVDGWRLALKFGFYSLVTAPRLQHLRMMTMGLWHGLKGRSGSFETPSYRKAPGMPASSRSDEAN